MKLIYTPGLIKQTILAQDMYEGEEGIIVKWEVCYGDPNDPSQWSNCTDDIPLYQRHCRYEVDSNLHKGEPHIIYVEDGEGWWGTLDKYNVRNHKLWVEVER